MLTSALLHLMEIRETVPPLDVDQAIARASELGAMSGMTVYPRSITAGNHTVFFLGRRGEEKCLGVLRRGTDPPDGFAGETLSMASAPVPCSLTRCPADSATAAALREALPYLAPRPLGLRKSAGCGDRLGLATPGHVRAVRRTDVAPIFAQQSMRENARTGRNPQQVMDEALWGVFQEGWREGFGADADHLKSAADVDLCVAAGYTFYTFDPGEYVDNRANTARPAALEGMASLLPWGLLETSLQDLQNRLAEKPLDLGSFQLTIGSEELLRAAIKYGKAVAHTVSLFRHLAAAMGSRPFELEMSVDETETVTSLAEHVYIAHELTRLGVRWVSLAPRYVGTFEKGVDYIGDLAAFEDSFARHLAVARTYGPYKLSLHSGSDKFSIYPIAARLAGELVHLKTAGTSYLEALRAVAELDPSLFRRIVAFCRNQYPSDRVSYHVSAEEAKVPEVNAWEDGKLVQVLDDFHAREVLHVTFGSVLRDPHFRGPFFGILRGNEEVYYRMLESHFMKHLQPFSG